MAVNNVAKSLSELLNEHGISSVEGMTLEDFKRVLDLNITDPKVLKQYYSFISEAVPKVLQGINNLVSQNISKDVVKTFQMRVEALNKRFETEKNPEVLNSIRSEVSEILDRIQEESNSQRSWIKSIGFGAIGVTALAGAVVIGVKNKEVGKNIAQTGLNMLKK